jgi:hypothetical protein
VTQLCPKCRSYLWNKPRVRRRKLKGTSIKELARQLNPRHQIVHEACKDFKEREGQTTTIT